MRFKIFFSLMLISSTTLFGQSVRSERRLINAGNDLFREGKYAEAVQKYRGALVENPSSAVAKFNLGLSRVTMAEKIEKNDSVSQRLLAEGINDLTEIARMGDKKSDLASKANYNLGNLNFEKEDYASAIQLYKQALRLNPNFNDARRNLRIAQLKQQNKKDNNKDNNQDNNRDQKDQQDKQQDQQNQDKKDQQNQQDQQQNQQDQQDKQQTPPDNEISPQTASQILNAVENNEAQTRARKGNKEGEKARGAAGNLRKW